MITAVYQATNVLCGGWNLHKTCIEVSYTISLVHWYSVWGWSQIFTLCHLINYTCSESMQGEVRVSRIMKLILQTYREVLKEHKNW